ncbi:MAG TPA: hypothetical protein VI636_01310 [Candidatus Angelobacter sp.]
MSPAQEASHSTGWVVIPVEEYQSLRARAFPSAVEPALPPVDATLTRVDYDLRIAGELATGRASLTVDVLRDGWVRVAIPSGLLVREARLDGKLVSLVAPAQGKGGGQLSAVLSHPGRAMLLLDIALPVASGAGEESMILPSTDSGVTRAVVQLPQQGVDVKLSGGLLVEKSEPSASTAVAGQSKWLAYGRGNEPLTFTWHRKLDDHRLEQPLRLRGSLIQLLGLGEDLASIYAEVNLEVNQGAAREVQIQLPETVNINQVSGAMVADWEMKPGELKVIFLEPVEQSARFVITGETRTAREGQIQVPLLRLLNTERESGGVAVEVLGAGEIKDVQSQGLESAAASDLGEMVANRQSPSLVAFRLHTGDAKANRSLTINVARYAQQAVLLANVEEARYQVLISSEGKVLVQARYAIRNNQRNFLKIALPQGATLWSATLAGRPVRPGESPDGNMLLPLEKARAGDDAPVFAVEVFYLSRQPAWNDKGQARLDLPALDLPISRTGLVLYHPLLFKVTPAPGAFRVERYGAPSSPALNPAVAAAAPAGQPAAGDGAAPSPEIQNFAYSYWSKSGARTARVLPIRVSFPAFGPSVFLVSELTAENHAESVELSYQREKKEGVR